MMVIVNAIDCRSSFTYVQDIEEHNCQIFEGAREEVIAGQYELCGIHEL